MPFTAKDILTLSRAGYNSAQIAEIARAAEMENSKTENPAPDPAPAPEVEKAAPAPAPAPVKDNSGDILAKLTELTSAVQMGNMMRDQQPSKETAEDIIASIIRPPILNSGE